MFPDLYRQSREYRAEAIRRAEQARLAKVAREARRIVRPVSRSAGSK